MVSCDKHVRRRTARGILLTIGLSVCVWFLASQSFGPLDVNDLPIFATSYREEAERQIQEETGRVQEEIERVRNDTAKPTNWNGPLKTVVNLGIDDGTPRWPIKVPYHLKDNQLRGMKGCFHNRTCLHHVKFLQPSPTNPVMGLTNALLDLIGVLVVGSLTNLVILPQERYPGSEAFSAEGVPYLPGVLDINATRMNLARINIVMLTVEEYETFFWDPSTGKAWVDLVEINSDQAFWTNESRGREWRAHLGNSLRGALQKLSESSGTTKAGIRFTQGSFMRFDAQAFAPYERNMLLSSFVFNQNIRQGAFYIMDQMRKHSTTRLMGAHLRIEHDAQKFTGKLMNNTQIEVKVREFRKDLETLCRLGDCDGIYLATGDLTPAEYEALRQVVPGKKVWFKNDFPEATAALRNDSWRCKDGRHCQTTSAAEAAMDLLILQHASVTAHLNPLPFGSSFSVLITACRDRSKARSGHYHLTPKRFAQVFRGIIPEVPNESVLVQPYPGWRSLSSARRSPYHVNLFVPDPVDKVLQDRRWLYEGLVAPYMKGVHLDKWHIRLV